MTPARTCALALLLAVCPASPPSATEAVDCRAGSTFPALTEIGAWNWCQDPKAVTYIGEHRRTYTGWVADDGSIMVASYDHESGGLTTSNVHERLERDDHDNPVFQMLCDGRVRTYYSPHGGSRNAEVLQGLFYRTSRLPEDVGEWTDELRLLTNTDGFWGWTYPNIATLEDEGECGRTYAFWRGGDGRPALSFTDDEGARWSDALPVITSDGVRPYVKIVSDGATTIHLAFTDGHPWSEPTNSLYYCFYEDGVFRRADGTRIRSIEELPLLAREADRVYDARADSVRCWVWDIALDMRARPVIAYTRFPDATDHRYRYARWNGSFWDDHEICAAGGWTGDADSRLYDGRAVRWYSGGIALDHSDPSIVYLSRPIDGVFEIERWRTGDGGATWIHEPVTCGSEADNIRPVVPRGHTPDGPDVLWLHGDYVHYRGFKTSIRMRTPQD